MSYSKIKRGLIGVLVIFLMTGSAIAQSQQSNKKQPSHIDNRGTTASPLVVKLLDFQNAQEAQEKTSNDKQLASATVGLLIVGLVQAALFLWQLILIRESLADAKEAAEAATIGAAAAKESADATTSIASILERNGKKQMRAYLTVITGSCFKQDREKNTRYEIRIFVKNTGFTPAHAVSCRMKADIFPYPLPEDIDLSLPIVINETGGYIASGQNNFFTTWLSDFIDDQTITDITNINGKALYVYGTIKYKDAFGDSHHTNFCQFALWDSGGNYSTMNAHRNNDAT